MSALLSRNASTRHKYNKNCSVSEHVSRISFKSNIDIRCSREDQVRRPRLGQNGEHDEKRHCGNHNNENANRGCVRHVADNYRQQEQECDQEQQQHPGNATYQRPGIDVDIWVVGHVVETPLPNH